MFDSIPFSELGILGLFLGSFLAATILPFSSELLLLGFLAADFSPMLCLWVATFGNTLGSVSSYGLGRLGKWNWLGRAFKIKKVEVERFQTRVEYYGSPLGLICFLPVMGDVVAVALGFFRTHFFLTVFFIFIGKLVRYLVVIYAGVRLVS